MRESSSNAIPWYFRRLMERIARAGSRQELKAIGAEIHRNVARSASRRAQAGDALRLVRHAYRDRFRELEASLVARDLEGD